MNFKDFSLMDETEDSYQVGHPNGKSMTIPKKGMSEKAHALVKKLKPVKMAQGGLAEDPNLMNDLDALAVNSQGMINPPDPSIAQQAGSVVRSGVGDALGAFGNVASAVAGPVVKGVGDFAKGLLTGEQAAEAAQPQVVGVSNDTSLPVQSVSEVPVPEEKIPELSKEEQQIAKQNEKNKKALETSLDQSLRLGNEIEREYKKASALQSKLETPDQIMDRFKAQDEMYKNELAAKKVDPHRLFNSYTTGQRIQNGIAMILGGFGGGRGPNPVAEMMEKAIDRDIDAQKNDQANTMNLWKMNREKLQTDLQANLATQNQILMGVKLMAERAAASAQNANAAGKMIELVQQIDQKAALNNLMRSRVSGGAPGSEAEYVKELNIASQINKEVKKDMEAKYIPGFGTTRIAPTEKQREQLIAMSNFKKLAQNAEHFAKTVGTTGYGTEANAQAENIRMGLYELLPAIRGINASTDAKIDLFSKSIDSPGSLRTGKFLAQLNELRNDTAIREQTLHTNLGAMPFKQAPQDQAAIAWAKSNPGTPQAQKILQLNGVR